MTTLYWITVLGNLSVALTGIFISLIIVSAVALIGYFMESGDFGDKNLQDKCKKVVKKTSIPLLVTLLLLVFSPSKRELYIIYGVGSTIDYIKSNDKAKQLPDKAIEALSKYLESINEEKK